MKTVFSHVAKAWIFSGLSTPSGLRQIGTTPRTILKFSLLPNFLRDFLPGLSVYVDLVCWFQFNQEVYSSVAATCIESKKALEPDFCAQMSWWKSVTSHTIQTIHTMHHRHHHRHHDCFIFNIAEMSALPPSPSQWFWQKGHKRLLTSEKKRLSHSNSLRSKLYRIEYILA